ncbi:hypothetical protein D3C87_103430 [compost metagenome]
MANRRFLKSLEKGQVVQAVVDEVLSVTESICAFQGDLLRIHNRTGMVLQKGQAIRLQVRSTSPLEFQIFDSQALKFERVV